MDERSRRLRRIGSKRWVFRCRRNDGRKRIPHHYVRGLLLVERSCRDIFAGVSIEFRYAGCVDESV